MFKKAGTLIPFFLIALFLLSTLAMPSKVLADIGPEWPYSKQVTITNPSSNTLNDYQVKISLTVVNFDFSLARSDGGDIRFTDEDGTTLLNHWLESYDAGERRAVFWVKVPTIPGNSDKYIWMYYGNPNAISTSSASNTFISGNDFNDGVISDLTVNTSGASVVEIPPASAQELYGFKVDGWDKLDIPTLPKGQSGWDSYGTREIALVISESDGKVVKDADGQITAYYWGTDSPSGTMQIGIARSADGGFSFSRGHKSVVISPSRVSGSWYETDISQPSVIKRSSDGLLMMMATGWQNDDLHTSSLGVFTSSDGLTWMDRGQKLTLSQFHYASGQAVAQMGVPAVIKRSSGGYFLLFEARSSAANTWRIFAATSDDFVGTWTPYNGGYPVFQENPGNPWESVGTANPRLIEVAPNQFVMAYNGIGATTNAYWRIGFASTTDFITWQRYVSNPVLGPSLTWDTQQTETAFLVKGENNSIGKLYYHGFDSAGAHQVGLAINYPGRILHTKTSNVAAGWVVGKDLDGLSTFAFEYIIEENRSDVLSSAQNSIITTGLMDWGEVPSPMGNTEWNPHDRVFVARLSKNSLYPCQVYVGYIDTTSNYKFWNGNDWGVTQPMFGDCSVNLIKVQIADDGVNYKIDVTDYATGASVIQGPAILPKSSVKSFSEHVVALMAEPFTNYYQMGMDFDNVIIRNYSSPEPIITVGP